ncbi:MAG: M20 family metallopeptidase [Deltaproteobacteria bacterium]|nr:M20 family metallopeptidase [Deltaproteobacteria bacterium]
MDAARLKRDARDAVDAMRHQLLNLSHAIHANPELSFEEHQAAALLSDAIEQAGLEVERSAYGLETAFCSNFGANDGACVALLAEYDALPGIGHACGHNLIATAGVGAGLALARLGDALPGRIRILGTPAEETGGGKELMARCGAFDGVDAAMMIHPSGLNLINMPCICMAEVEVRYRGTAAHASAMPERGVNALDALVIAYQAIGALRQHIARDERLHGIISNGGQAPNIVPDLAIGRFYARAVDAERLIALKRRLEGCFEAGAAATGAKLEIDWCDVDYRDIHFNAPLAECFQENAEQLGREFFPVDKLPSNFRGSTDMGNVSYRVPSIHPMIASAPIHCTIHNPEFAKWAGSEMGDSAALDGAKALAMTAIDFLCDEDLQKRSRSWFEANATNGT